MNRPGNGSSPAKLDGQLVDRNGKLFLRLLLDGQPVVVMSFATVVRMMLSTMKDEKRVVTAKEIELRARLRRAVDFL